MIGFVAWTAGCSDQRTGAEGSMEHSTPIVASSELSGSQLWEQNCARCHYMRGPRWYNDVEWDVAMLHMRIQTNLTGQEHRAILKFLQAAN